MKCACTKEKAKEGVPRMAKKKQHRRNRKSGIVFPWYWLLLAFGAMLVFLFLGYRPELQSMRETLAYQVVMKMIPTGVLLYFAWVAKSRPPKTGQIIMTLMAAVFWQGLIIPSRRALLLSNMILVFAGIGYLFYLWFRRNQINKPLLGAAAFFGLMLMQFNMDYTFLDGKEHYWLISLVLALLVGAVGCYLMIRGLIVLKDDRISEKICWCFLVTFAAFVLFWTTANNLNYLLDFSQPQQCFMTIAEKDIDSSRSGTYYEFTLVYEGKEIELDVSQSEYYQYEIGDSFPVDLYQGFFGDAYYIAE